MTQRRVFRGHRRRAKYGPDFRGHSIGLTYIDNQNAKNAQRNRNCCWELLQNVNDTSNCKITIKLEQNPKQIQNSGIEYVMSSLHWWWWRVVLTILHTILFKVRGTGIPRFLFHGLFWTHVAWKPMNGSRWYQEYITTWPQSSPVWSQSPHKEIYVELQYMQSRWFNDSKK